MRCGDAKTAFEWTTRSVVVTTFLESLLPAMRAPEQLA
jgi:hypothetical protein